MKLANWADGAKASNCANRAAWATWAAWVASVAGVALLTGGCGTGQSSSNASGSTTPSGAAAEPAGAAASAVPSASEVCVGQRGSAVEQPDDGSNGEDAEAANATVAGDTAPPTTNEMPREGDIRDGDVVVLATTDAPDLCVTDSEPIRLDVRRSVKGNVESGEQVEVSIDESTYRSAIDNRSGLGLFVLEGTPGEYVATMAVGVNHRGVSRWVEDSGAVEPLWCSNQAPRESGAESAGDVSGDVADVDSRVAMSRASDAIVVVDVLYQASRNPLVPTATRCANGAQSGHRAVVEVVDVLQGELRVGSVLLVTAFDTAAAMRGTDRSRRDLVLAVNADQQLPGVGTVDWAAYGYGRVGAWSAEAQEEWFDAIGDHDQGAATDGVATDGAIGTTDTSAPPVACPSDVDTPDADSGEVPGVPATADLVAIVQIDGSPPCPGKRTQSDGAVAWVVDGPGEPGRTIDLRFTERTYYSSDITAADDPGADDIAADDTGADDTGAGKVGASSWAVVANQAPDGWEVTAAAPAGDASGLLSSFDRAGEPIGCPGVLGDAQGQRRVDELTPGSIGAGVDVVAVDVIFRHTNVGQHPEPGRCRSGAVDAHRALVVVTESLRGDLERGDVLEVTTFDTDVVLADDGGEAADPSDRIIAISPAAKLPGIGMVERAAVGRLSVTFGSTDDREAWRSALGAP